MLAQEIAQRALIERVAIVWMDDRAGHLAEALIGQAVRGKYLSNNTKGAL